MNHKLLVENLANDLKPVQVTKYLAFKVVTLQLGVIVFLTMLMLVLNKEPVEFYFQSRWYVMGIGISVFVSSILLWGAMKLSVPGNEKSPWIKPLSYFSSVLLVSTMIGYSIEEGMSLTQDWEHWVCILPSVGFSFLAGGIYSVFLSKKLAPTEPKETLAMVMASASVIVGAFTSVYCIASSPVHQILWHYAPVIFLSLFGFQMGRKVLRW